MPGSAAPPPAGAGGGGGGGGGLVNGVVAGADVVASGVGAGDVSVSEPVPTVHLPDSSRKAAIRTAATASMIAPSAANADGLRYQGVRGRYASAANGSKASEDSDNAGISGSVGGSKASEDSDSAGISGSVGGSVSSAEAGCADG